MIGNIFGLLLLTAGWAERGTTEGILIFLLIWHIPSLLVYRPFHKYINRKYETLSKPIRTAISLLMSMLLYDAMMYLVLWGVGKAVTG